MSPQLIFGTAIFGQDLTDFQDAAAIEQLLKELQKLGVHRLDSGARYPPRMPGRSEELIGETKDVSGGFVVDTKVITDIQNDGSGDLTPEAIEKSTLASLKRLQRPEGVGQDPIPPRQFFVNFLMQLVDRSISCTYTGRIQLLHWKTRLKALISRSNKADAKL